MKIKDVITEDGSISSTVSGVIAPSITAGATGSIFAGVPLKRNMPRKRKRQEESKELLTRKDKSNVIEEKE